MLFSSVIFLFYFLPVIFLFYFSLPGIKIKNLILLLFSFIFFAWGGLFFTLILIASILFNYLMGLGIERKKKKFFLALGVTGNLLVLLSFKYADFIIANINSVFNTSMALTGIALPIGISFYTFHSISYLVDIYSGRSPAQRNILNMALYIVLFTQLIAGPIIRYNTFAPQLFGRTISYEKFWSGIERFIIGLGKKVLIANTVARVADTAFSQGTGNMDHLICWLGALCYTMQIYFDFSGYSDMAIGLSRMFGFEFPENFNSPYTATSIKDFWRRWHISLSSFFRDYLYIPLGGNKKGKWRTYFNLILVFSLTGLWHGANYTFIIWGLLHGVFLLLERTKWGNILERMPVLFQRTYAFIIVLLIWIPFRATDINYTFHFWKGLFDFSGESNLSLISSFFSTDFTVALILAILISFNFHLTLKNWLGKMINGQFAVNSASALQAAFLLLVLFFSTVYLMSGTYNPFIYYQF